MTFKPTKAQQKEWVSKHLNGGVCPLTKRDYNNECFSGNTACWEALNWLSETDITTLAEAWERCERPDWLMWMLVHMEPDRDDYNKGAQLATMVTTSRYGPCGLHDELEPNYVEWRRLVGSLLYYLERKFREYHSATSRGAKAKFCAMIRELWPNPWEMKRGER